MITLLFASVVFIGTFSASANGCSPRNWGYPWTRVGNAWFAETPKKGAFKDIVSYCAKIDPGHTSIASVRSLAELNHLKGISLKNNVHWIGAVRISKRWYWYQDKESSQSITPIKKFFWRWGEPGGHENCIWMWDFKWSDAWCTDWYHGLCEVRC